MLSKRASLNPPLEKLPRRFRIEEEVTFIPSMKRDDIKAISIFLREVNQPEYPFQITIALNDHGLGRLGYYDLSYKDQETAQGEFNSVLESIRDVREQVEYYQMSSAQIEKLCRNAIDSVLHKAVSFDSTYFSKHRS